MNVDHHFEIGHAHDVCQDYAASDGDFAALSDGCSVVTDGNGNHVRAHTDVGARLLTMAAFYHRYDKPEYSNRHHYAIRTADQYRRQLCLPRECLSATLITLSLRPMHVMCSISGDGIIAARARDGQWKIHRFVYADSPYYLVYDLSGAVAFRGRPTDFIWDGDKELAYRCENFSNRYFSFGVFDLVVAMSDGATSFTKDGKSVEFNREFALRLLDFRRMRGRFVLRHLRGVCKELRQEGVVHQDDISMIAMDVGDHKPIVASVH